MKLRVDALTLTRALAPVMRFAKGAQSASGVLIRAEEGVVTLVGTDGTTSVRTIVPDAQIEEEGVVLVAARRMYDLAKALQPEQILLSTTSGALRVKGGQFAGVLTLMPVGNFPALRDVLGFGVTFDAADFRRAAEQVLPAVSRDETRPQLQAVKVQEGDGTLVLAAQDGVRVAEATLATEGKFGVRLLPALVVQEAARAGVTGLYAEEGTTNVALEGPGFKITTSSLDVDFPDYEKFMPSTYAHVFAADREKLMAAVGRVNLLSDDVTAVKVEIDNGKLKALLTVPGVGETSETVDLEGEGAFTAAFKPELLFDGLEGCAGESVIINVNEPLRPVLFNDTDGYRYLLMPARVAKPGE